MYVSYVVFIVLSNTSIVLALLVTCGTSRWSFSVHRHLDFVRSVLFRSFSHDQLLLTDWSLLFPYRLVNVLPAFSFLDQTYVLSECCFVDSRLQITYIPHTLCFFLNCELLSVCGYTDISVFVPSEAPNN